MTAFLQNFIPHTVREWTWLGVGVAATLLVGWIV